MVPKITFTGTFRERVQASAMISISVAEVAASRARRGPLLPGWNFAVELITTILRRRLKAAFEMNVAAARSFLNSIVVASPALSQVHIEEEESQREFRGRWITPINAIPDALLLYLHGGGYAFYPKDSYANVIAEVAVATNLRTFALDYRLAPEHQFPAQLEDAVAAYRYVSGLVPSSRRIIVAGDSAGGNLTLTLLLKLRELGLPQPALGFPISPATEFDLIRPSMLENERYDWLDIRMLARFATWFCGPDRMSEVLVSPSHADLQGLAPIYIQAGRREILFDGIQAFTHAAQAKGANVTLEAWDDMNHVFQCFGRFAPQSVQALARAKEVIGKSLAAATAG